MKSCKLIYSFLYPEVRSVVDKLWADKPHYLFDKSYLKSQEGKEIEFFHYWQKWTKSVLVHNPLLTHFYPTNGSSEAIREVIYQVKLKKRTLVVFENDYEGYKAFASACGLKVISITQDNALKYNFKKNQTLILSNPASVDGNLYQDYDALMTKISRLHEGCEVYVDLCYVGCVSKEYVINTDYPCIAGAFMSLSKVFGVYYHRIGGLISKEKSDGLFGNQWFKNMFSLQLGLELMKTFAVRELPNLIKPHQDSLCLELTRELGSEVKPSDVTMLAYSPHSIIGYERGSHSRICLTPGLDQLTSTKES